MSHYPTTKWVNIKLLWVLSQVHHPFRMALRKLTEPAQFYSVYNNHTGYLIRVFTLKIASGSDQTSSPLHT